MNLDPGVEASPTEAAASGPARQRRAAPAGNKRAQYKARMERELEAAILRVQTKSVEMTLQAVAEEVGSISSSAIIKTYGAIADKIRKIGGKGIRQQRKDALEQVKELEVRRAELLEELKQAKADIRKLSSINEALRLRVSELETASALSLRRLGR